MSIISNSTIKLNVTSEIQDVLSSFTLSKSEREDNIVLYSTHKANLNCTILNLQLVISLRSANILLIFYFYPIKVFELCFSGNGKNFNGLLPVNV